MVALRKESVDRNWQNIDDRETISVALRKESVDRNRQGSILIFRDLVALRKESVDRNRRYSTMTCSGTGRSPQGERG